MSKNRKFCRIIESEEFGQILLFIDDCPETNYPMLSTMFELDGLRGRANEVAKEETEEAVDRISKMMMDRNESDVIDFVRRFDEMSK